MHIVFSPQFFPTSLISIDNKSQFLRNCSLIFTNGLECTQCATRTQTRNIRRFKSCNHLLIENAFSFHRIHSTQHEDA